MKKVYFTLFAFTLATYSSAQSWMQETIQTTSKMRTIGFASDDMTGWVFSDSTIGLTFKYGAIYKTTNQGFSWIEQDMGTDSIQILDCHVFSGMNVVGVGKFQTTGGGAIIKTIDGGASWTRDTTTIPERLFDVEFEDASNGWVVGRNGYIGKSINGGTSWLSLTSGTTEDLYAISFSGLMNGWAVGADVGSGGTILQTTDGGTTWNAQTTISSGDLSGVYAVNQDTAYAVGQLGLILFTSDGGANWVTQTSGSIADLEDVEFIAGSSGRAVGAGGEMLLTTDAGVTWAPDVSNTINDIADLYYGANGIHWYCGDNGDVYIYTSVAPNSIDELQIVQSSAYPNPANEIIRIDSDLNAGSEIFIYDIRGMIVSQFTWSNSAKINVSGFNPGLYFYVIENTDERSMGKFIKE